MDWCLGRVSAISWFVLSDPPCRRISCWRQTLHYRDPVSRENSVVICRCQSQASASKRRQDLSQGATGGPQYDGSRPEDQGLGTIIPLIEIDQGGLIAKISFVCCAAKVLAETRTLIS